tara:strand:+ start:1233 stop:1568 length:336 start_codon:yes stop_codon:yes gene_type:complete
MVPVVKGIVMNNFNWLDATRHLKPGALVFKDRLSVDSVNDKRIYLTRVATKKPLIVTRSMIEKTHKRLMNGDVIAFRTISYTSAIEAVVINVLAGAVTTTKIDSKGHYIKT